MQLVRTTGSAQYAAGLRWGLVGVAALSLTVPLTRVAAVGLSPLFIASGRAVVAGVLAAGALTVTRQARPRGTQWIRLAGVAGGVVLGFPLLTSYALKTVGANHGAIVTATLPAVTAAFAAIRGRERQSLLFWGATLAGALAAVAFAVVQSGGGGHIRSEDLLLLGAVVSAAIGYTEGGLLARELGPWQTISWALVVCSPLMLLLAAASMAHQLPSATAAQWDAFAYLGVVSMFLGFFAWYRGLAIGPITQVSQMELLRPVLSIFWAGLLLGEQLTWATAVGGLSVVLCAAAAVRLRLPGSGSQVSQGVSR